MSAIIFVISTKYLCNIKVASFPNSKINPHERFKIND